MKIYRENIVQLIRFFSETCIIFDRLTARAIALAEFCSTFILTKNYWSLSIKIDAQTELHDSLSLIAS